MKHLKLLLLFTLVGLSTQSYSQEDQGKLTIETRYQLRKDSSYVPNLNFRYFFNEENALRIGLAYKYYSNTREVMEVNDDGVGTVEKLSNLFLFSVGYEKHFKKNNVSPYFGGELKLGIGKLHEYGSRTDSVTFISDFDYSIKTPLSQFGVHLFSGVDVYLFENFYLGTELGVQFLKSDVKRGEYKASDGSSLTASEVTESLPAVSTKLFDLTNVGVIRLGWRF